ncbi:MAG: pantoate--beta-alanine ligase [Planctomycetota bacterium]|nr:pantoate--beta-alanine ligase [Planctomycetota bacterium]
MRVVTSRAEMAAAGRHGCVLVPTMGALHAGHATLIELARARAGACVGGTLPVVVSIFVNPSQFNEATDFDVYPRDLDADCAWCARLGVDVVFAPGVDVVYPPDEDVPVGELPAVAKGPGLEDSFRPGHFAGVCRVVRRLIALTGAAAAVFGEKDWQQLQVVRAMVEADRKRGGPDVEIVPAATVREAGGLAMSSRNRLLDAAGRRRAGAISRAIRGAGAIRSPAQAERHMAGVLEAAGLEVEYAVVRDAETLGEVRPGFPCRALVAVGVAVAGAGGGVVRLIDNRPWPAVGPAMETIAG